MKKEDLSLKKGLLILGAVFLLATVISRWVEWNSNTIADSMPLHRKETPVPKATEGPVSGSGVDISGAGVTVTDSGVLVSPDSVSGPTVTVEPDTTYVSDSLIKL